MNNKEAREILDHNWTRLVNPDYSDEELGEAQNLAIEALSAEPCEDAISREAVLELTKLISEDYSRERDSMEIQIKKLPSVKVVEPQWISVKDSRKPKIRERVWVTDCDGEVWIMYYNDCDCYFNEFGDVFTEDDIVAWQPITEPSPYKGE